LLPWLRLKIRMSLFFLVSKRGFPDLPLGKLLLGPQRNGAQMLSKASRACRLRWLGPDKRLGSNRCVRKGRLAALPWERGVLGLNCL